MSLISGQVNRITNPSTFFGPILAGAQPLPGSFAPFTEEPLAVQVLGTSMALPGLPVPFPLVTTTNGLFKVPDVPAFPVELVEITLLHGGQMFYRSERFPHARAQEGGLDIFLFQPSSLGITAGTISNVLAGFGLPSGATLSATAAGLGVAGSQGQGDIQFGVQIIPDTSANLGAFVDLQLNGFNISVGWPSSWCKSAGDILDSIKAALAGGGAGVNGPIRDLIVKALQAQANLDAATANALLDKVSVTFTTIAFPSNHTWPLSSTSDATVVMKVSPALGYPRGWREAAVGRSVIGNSDGRQEVFTISADWTLRHIWQENAHAGPWSPWSSLDGAVTGAPALARNDDQRVEVFARGIDGALWHIWQENPHAGPWSAWSSLAGAIASDPVVAVNSDGRLEVFVRGTDNTISHIWQENPSNGPWSAWSSLGAPAGDAIVGDPAVARNADGRLEIFVRTAHAIWHIWQENPHAGPWSAWTPLPAPSGGTIAGDPVVGLNADGRLEVFIRGAGNALWHIWQEKPSNGPWPASWSSLGGVITSDPVVATNSDGRLKVFARGTDDALWHNWQENPSNGPWSGWSSLHAPPSGAISSAPVATLNTDGRLEVFARGAESMTWHVWQQSSHAGPWSGWDNLGRLD